MPGTCVIGLQWGDEAKGKIVDLLTREHDFVVRYQGGANAGHTVVVGDQVYKLSLLPSGILTPGVTCVIATGVVINPARVIEELDELAKRGAGHADNLRISDRAHVIFPWHFAEDRALDKNTSDGENIGTTGRGIGPCYRDKVGRSHAIRLGDLYRPTFREQVEHIVAAKNRVLEVLYPAGEFKPLDAADIIREYTALRRAAAAVRLRHDRPAAHGRGSRQADAVRRRPRRTARRRPRHVSRSSRAATARASASPAAPACRRGTSITCIGVVKAYSTRVGGGPFPTEQDNATGQYLRDRGNEYGTVTRRPRRCGWLDVVALRYTSRLSGVDAIAVMLLDVLSGLDEIKICTAYDDRRQINRRGSPATSTISARRSPCTKRCPAGRKKSRAAASYADLPENAKAYLRRISELVGQPVEMVSVGPERDQTIVVSKM